MSPRGTGTAWKMFYPPKIQQSHQIARVGGFSREPAVCHRDTKKINILVMPIKKPVNSIDSAPWNPWPASRETSCRAAAALRGCRTRTDQNLPDRKDQTTAFHFRETHSEDRFWENACSWMRMGGFVFRLVEHRLCSRGSQQAIDAYRLKKKRSLNNPGWLFSRIVPAGWVVKDLQGFLMLSLSVQIQWPSWEARPWLSRENTNPIGRCRADFLTRAAEGSGP